MAISSHQHFGRSLAAKRRLMMRQFAGVCVVVLVAWGIVTAQSQSDPRIGIWKVNFAKSKFQPDPPPESLIRTYELDGDALKATIEVVTAEGDHRTSTYTAKYDGKDYAYTGRNVDTVALRRVDDRTLEVTLKKGNKVVGTNRIVVSKDGKTMTQTLNEINARGLHVHNVVVYDKQ